MVYRSQDLGAGCAHFYWTVTACRPASGQNKEIRERDFSPNSKFIGSILQKYSTDRHLVIADVFYARQWKMFVISSTSERKVTVNGGPKEVKKKKML